VLDGVEDSELILASLERPGMFEGIFDRHYDSVRIYAQRRVGTADGEELAASTFEVAFAHRARFDADRFTSARPWLLGIANNLVRRHVRRGEVRRRLRPLSIAIDDAAPEPALDRVVAETQRPAIRAALARLSGDDRETFLLLVLGDLSYAEVAESVGVPLGTVRSRVNRARGLLRELLSEAEAINPGMTTPGESDG
jgi:RNA polymerase sigma-70 factor (ECF subfamily)